MNIVGTRMCKSISNNLKHHLSYKETCYEMWSLLGVTICYEWCMWNILSILIWPCFKCITQINFSGMPPESFQNIPMRMMVDRLPSSNRKHPKSWRLRWERRWDGFIIPPVLTHDALLYPPSSHTKYGGYRIDHDLVYSCIRFNLLVCLSWNLLFKISWVCIDRFGWNLVWWLYGRRPVGQSKRY